MLKIKENDYSGRYSGNEKIEDFLMMSFSKSTWGIYYPKNWFLKFYIYMIGHAKVFGFETAV